VPVYVGPSVVDPIATTSVFPEDDLRRALGPEALRLKTAFRLESGARIPVPVRQAPARAATGIAVVSALHHSYKFVQGEPILRLTAIGQAGEQRVELLAGESTSLSEYDVPRPGTLKITKAKVIASRPHPGDRKTWNHKPLTLYTYVAVLPFAEPILPDKIEVQCLSAKGVVDVYEMALVFGGDSTRQP
jgi:hypothetical protein